MRGTSEAMVEKIRRAGDGSGAILFDFHAFARDPKLATDPWLVTGTMRWSEEGGLAVRSLAVRPLARIEMSGDPEAPEYLPAADADAWVPDGGLTTEMLSNISVRHLVESARDDLRYRPGLWEHEMHEADRAAAEGVITEQRARGDKRDLERDIELANVVLGGKGLRRGRPRIDRAEVRQFAIRCLEAAESHPRAPIRRLIHVTGWSESKVKKWIQRARDLRYLEPTSQGRSRIEAGPELKERQA